MTTLRFDFDTGTVNTDITAAASGPDGIDAVQSVSGGTKQFSNTHVGHGTQAGKFATGVSSGRSSISWASGSLPGSTTGPFYSRVNVYLTAYPTSAVCVLNFLETGTTGNVCGVRVNTDGTLSVLRNGGVIDFTTTSVTPLNTWFRIELKATVGTGFFGTPYTMRYYDTIDSDVITETRSNTTTLGGSTSGINFGIAIAATNAGPIWLDDLGYSNTDWLGPVSILKSGSDSGVAADALGTLATSSTTSETSTGTENQSSATSRTTTESSVATDTGNVFVPAFSADTAVGVDENDPVSTLNSTDTGVGTDASIGISAQSSDTEVGVGVENNPSLQDTQFGVFTEIALVVSVALASAETGNGADVGTRITFSAAETGTATDAILAGGTITSVTDREAQSFLDGSGDSRSLNDSDSVSVQTVLPFPIRQEEMISFLMGDSTLFLEDLNALEAESNTVSANVAGADSVGATDNELFGSQTHSDSDIVQASDASTSFAIIPVENDTGAVADGSPGIGKGSGDTGTGTEQSLSIRATTTRSSDTGVGGNSEISTAAHLSGADHGTGTEISGVVSFVTPIFDSDSGTTDDVMGNANARLTYPDQAAGSETSVLAAEPARAEFARGKETVILTAYPTAAQVGAFAETTSLRVVLPRRSDIGFGTETWAVRPLVNKSDTGRLRETSTLVVLVHDSDTGDSDDEQLYLVVAIAKSDSDNGEGSEIVGLALTASDTVNGLEQTAVLGNSDGSGVPVAENEDGSTLEWEHVERYLRWSRLTGIR